MHNLHIAIIAGYKEATPTQAMYVYSSCCNMTMGRCHTLCCRVKEAMVDSANERIADLKRAAADAQASAAMGALCLARWAAMWLMLRAVH